MLALLRRNRHPLSLLCCVLWPAARASTEIETLGSLSSFAIPLALLILFLGAIAWGIFTNRRLKIEIERRQRAEITLIEAGERALEAADSKAAFFAALSHEIRNPMNGVIGLIDSLTHTRLDENQRYQLGVVARSAKMSLAVLNDALDYAGVKAGRLALSRSPSEILPLAEDLALMYAPLAAERGLVFQLSVAPDLPLLLIDPLRIRQIAANFIANAIRHTEQGFVRLSVAGSAQSEKCWKLVIEVQDSGQGILDPERSQAFQPFESPGGPGSPGTGLGLTVCRALSEAIGGQIEVGSTQGCGSRFRFTLDAESQPAPERPLPFVGIAIRSQICDSFWRSECSAWLRTWGAQIVGEGDPSPSHLTLSDFAELQPGQSSVILLRESSHSLARDREGRVRLEAQPLLPTRLRLAIERALTPPPAIAPSTEAVPKRARRVLVVDDEPLNLRVATQLLALLGFEATAVAEPQAGFEAFCSTPFVAILLDYRMPGEDGISLAARMRLRERNHGFAPTPIVAVTADASESTASACLASGMDHVLLKPLTLESLHDTLMRLGCKPVAPPEMESIEAEEAGDSATVLAYLAGLVGSVERAHSIADGFIESSLADLAELQKKLEIEDFDATRFLAHRIKGGARNAGFEQVGNAAFELERAARAAEGENCHTHTAALMRSLDRLRKLLAEA